MEISTSPTLGCRYCRHYTPEGRRGGQCQQLGVSVKGSWKACSLAIPVFKPSWETLEQIVVWQDDPVRVQAITVSDSASSSNSIAGSEHTSVALPEITVKTLRTNCAA